MIVQGDLIFILILLLFIFLLVKNDCQNYFNEFENRTLCNQQDKIVK